MSEPAYRRHTIAKRDGRVRELAVPAPDLMARQRRILDEVLAALPVHAAVHGFVRGRSPHTNAAQHTDAAILVRVDLRDFFPTVTTARVVGIFRRAGLDAAEAHQMANLCTLDGKLPQGAPTSPALANAAAHRLDRRLAGLSRSLGWRYTRYADDLTFSVPCAESRIPNGAFLISSVTRIVQEEGFVVNEAKTKRSGAGERHRVTGLVVNGPDAPRVPRSVRRELRSAVHRARETGATVAEAARLRGLVAHVSTTHPDLGARLLRELQEVKLSP